MGHYSSDWARVLDNHRVDAAPRRFFPLRAPKLTQRMGTGSPVPSTNERTGHHNLVCNEKAPGTPGLSCVCAIQLLDLDDRAFGRLQLADAIDHVPRELEQRARVRRLIALEHDRLAGIAALADVGIDLNAAQERHAELSRRALAAALGEDVDLVAGNADTGRSPCSRQRR